MPIGRSAVNRLVCSRSFCNLALAEAERSRSTSQQRAAKVRPGARTSKAGFGQTEFSAVWAYTPSVLITPAMPSYTTPAIPPKLITPEIPSKLLTPYIAPKQLTPAVPATYITIAAVKAPRVCKRLAEAP